MVSASFTSSKIVFVVNATKVPTICRVLSNSCILWPNPDALSERRLPGEEQAFLGKTLPPTPDFIPVS